jgi:hypothetical protein
MICCRSTRISASNAARRRNRSRTIPIIILQRSNIPQKIIRSCVSRQLDGIYDRDTVVTDSVATGKKNEAAPSAKLLAAVTEKPMEIIEAENQKVVPVGAGYQSKMIHQPHAKRSCCPSMYSQIEADRKALPCACGARLATVSDARCPRWRTRG